MELLAQSNVSVLRGASSPEALVERAAQFGHQSIALVDHQGFYGSARAHVEAKKLGLKAIVGTTIDSLPAFAQLPLLTKSRTGYQNLSRFLTRYHCEQNVNNLSSLDLTGIHAVLTPESLARPTKKKLLAAARDLLRHFGPGNVSISLFRHFHGEERLNPCRISRIFSKSPHCE